MRRVSYSICIRTKLITNLLFYFIFINIVTSQELTECDLKTNCMDESNFSLVNNLTTVTCQKSDSCQLVSNSSFCQKPFNVALEKFKVKDNWIQIQLATSPQAHLESNLNGSLLIKLSFKDNAICYNFVISPLLSSSAKESFLLPCIPLWHRKNLYLIAYYFEANEYEMLTFQAVQYTLEGTSEVQELESGSLSIAPSFDNRLFHLSRNVAEDESCSISYNISIYESHGKQICDFQRLVNTCRWSSVLKSSSRYLTCNWNTLKPCQKYCIRAFFRNHENCKYVYPDQNLQVTFFEFSKLELGFLSQPVCKNWNISLYANSENQKIQVLSNASENFSNCFDYYKIMLYRKKSHECNISYGKPKSVISIKHALEQVKSHFENISNGNYCVLITPCVRKKCYPCAKNKCFTDWTRHNKVPIQHINGKSTDWISVETPLLNNPQFPTDVILAMGIIFLLITGLGVGCFIKRHKKPKIEFHEIPQEIVPELAPRQPTDTLVFPTSDASEEVDRLVSAVQNYAGLSIRALKDFFHEIYNRRDDWFRRSLHCECRRRDSKRCSSNKRIVIVLTDKSIRIIQDPENVEMDNYEEAFSLCVQHLRRNEKYAKNHCHVLKMCSRSTDGLDDIMRKGHYLSSSPDDIVDLCVDLGSTVSREYLKSAFENDPEFVEAFFQN